MDTKHVKVLLAEWGLENSRSVSSPGVAIEKAHEEKKKDEEEKLNSADAKKYRRAAARINYMALDRADLGFSAKEAASEMANPSVGDVVRLKRIMRYLVGAKRVYTLFQWQDADSTLRVYTDSDWAGCSKTRKSTSGGMIMRGSHLIHHWTSSQATIALSVAEAELNALVKGAAEAISLYNMSLECGMTFKIDLYTDSSSAKGIIHREGCGKVKHLEVRQLWIQDVIHRKEVKAMKIPREYNCSDAMTHCWSCKDGLRHFRYAGLRWV